RQHRGVGLVASGPPPAHGRREGGWPAPASLSHRLADGYGCPDPRPAQRRGVPRSPRYRPERARRTARRRRDLMSHGPLQGIRVVELASEHAAFGGKLMADLGADCIVVEPPGGHWSRGFAPFADDHHSPDTSVWWWHYNTSKRGVTIDLATPSGRDAFRALCRGADGVLECEPPGRL